MNLEFSPPLSDRVRRTAARRSALLTLLTASCLLVASMARADATGLGNIVTNGCMENLGNKSYGCTANDVEISGIADTSGDGLVDENDVTFAPVCDATALNKGANCASDPGICQDADGLSAPDLCGDRCAFPGDTTTFSVSLIFLLNSQDRFDVAAFFDIAGDSEGDGALSGTCDIVTLPETGSFTRPDGSAGDFVDLDTTCTGGGCPQPGDLCGDITNASNPIIYDLKQGTQQLTISAKCVDSDGDGQLNLPSCTSWRQSGANTSCTDGSDTYPGSPSKCNCDPDFQVPISVPPASITVDKSTVTSSVNEPGGNVPFDVSVTNGSPFATVTITSLVDDEFGDLNGQGDCSVPQDIVPGGTYSCSFTGLVTGLGGTTHVNVVTAMGVDENGNMLTDDDDARVPIVDLLPAIDVSKSVSPASRLEPGGDFTYSITVTNNSGADALTLTVLEDDVYGNLDGQGTCATGGTIALGGSYSCSFTAAFFGNPGDTETDTVTATGEDDEGNAVSDTDMATISLTDVASSCSMDKSVSPETFPETDPGLVTFSVLLQNTSKTDSITVDLVDSVYGDLNGLGTCASPQTLAIGDSYSCSFTDTLADEPGPGPTLHHNVLSANGTDDDGETVSCSDSATVTITDVKPAISIDKSVDQRTITFRLKVTNTGPEAVTIDSIADLGDNGVGDLSEYYDTDCGLITALSPGEEAECTFTGTFTDLLHLNFGRVTASDDDGNTVSDDSGAVVVDVRLLDGQTRE